MDSDYREYLVNKSEEELIDISRSIDREKYPEKYKMVMERLEELGEKTRAPQVEAAADSEEKSPESETIETGKKKHTEYASVWIRFAAILIDGIILLPFYIPIYIISPMYENGGEPGNAVALIFFLSFLAAVIFGFWNTVVRMGKTGQSLGRKFLNIAVLNPDGSTIGVGRALLREWIGRAISALVCYIGYLNAFWDKDRQMWHDKLASCYVYYVEENFS